VTAGAGGGIAGDRPGSLGELLLAFSAVTSEGLGLGRQHGVRACFVGMSVATDLELPRETVADVYYAALAKDGGCTCGARQMADFLGTDERGALADLLQRNPDSELEMLRWLFRNAGRGSSPPTRLRHTIKALIHGARFEHQVTAEECEVAQLLALRLGLSDGASQAVATCLERWDGKGAPRALAGEDIPIAGRIVNLASAVEIANHLSGREAAIELVQQRSGAAFDPTVAESFLAVAADENLWAALEEDDLRDRVMAMEPADGRLPGGERALDRFTEVLADLIDLKRPATAGHARRVASWAFRLAGRIGLSASARAVLRRAALIHDLGLVAVSARDLARGEGGGSYRVHPVAPISLLADVPALNEACQLAALHHERADGSGWPAGNAAIQGMIPAQVLAASCALDELSSGREAEDARVLQRIGSGTFDGVVLDALASELGVSRPPRSEWPAGLTLREVEVLQLAATGLSVREIGQRLVISRHTARHHLESVYSKIGCSTRAAAALYAAEHGLLG